MAINDTGLYDIIQAQKSQQTGPRIPLVEDSYESIFVANDDRGLQIIDDDSMISNSQSTDAESMASDNMISDSDFNSNVASGGDNPGLTTYISALDNGSGLEPISDQQLDNLAALVLREKNRRQYGSEGSIGLDNSVSCPSSVKKNVALSKVAGSNLNAIKPIAKSIKNNDNNKINTSNVANIGSSISSSGGSIKANAPKASVITKKVLPSTNTKAAAKKGGAPATISGVFVAHATKPIETVHIKPIPTTRYNAGTYNRQGASHPNDKMFRTGPQPQAQLKSPKSTPACPLTNQIMSLASFQSKISKHLDNVQYNIERAMSTDCPTFPQKISAEVGGAKVLLPIKAVLADPIYDCISLQSGTSSVGDTATVLCISDSTAFDDMSMGSSGSNSARSFKTSSTNSGLRCIL